MWQIKKIYRGGTFRDLDQRLWRQTLFFCGLTYMNELFTTKIAMCVNKINSQFWFHADFNLSQVCPWLFDACKLACISEASPCPPPYEYGCHLLSASNKLGPVWWCIPPLLLFLGVRASAATAPSHWCFEAWHLFLQWVGKLGASPKEEFDVKYSLDFWLDMFVGLEKPTCC